MIKKYTDFDLSARNTFRMKVRCALYVEVTEEADLPALDWAALPQPVLVMGGGSNLLFTRDFPGTVLRYAGALPPNDPRGLKSLSDFCACKSPGPGRAPDGASASLQVPDETLVTVPAGVVFDDFCAWAASEGLWGPENLSLIPGECGASAVQNIGAYGVEAKDILADIRAWDRLERRFVHIDPASCAYGYRSSRFKTEWKGRYIITAVTYRLSRVPRPVLDYGGIRNALSCHSASLSCHSERSEESLTPQLIRDTIIGIRQAKLPAVEELGSAGSFFCNPVISREHFHRIEAIARADNGPDYRVPHYDTPDGIKVPAAWMIEQCGFKGKRLGGAEVYQNQPLVIVNASGTATPEDILGLERQVIAAVSAKYAITLRPEVEHI